MHTEDYIFELHRDLEEGAYSHGSYVSFYIFDPKRRHIHKARVIDRLLHHAIFRVLEPIYNKTFIFDSYSSRALKGTHKAIERFKKFGWILSQNNSKTVWVLKCDIRKFFDSIDHDILLNILSLKIKDDQLLRLLKNIIKSYTVKEGSGIPLGNLTSQLFSNVYLDILDQYIKRELRVKYYIRYADDFVILHNEKNILIRLLNLIDNFLKKRLLLSLHSEKIHIRKFNQGIDFLGYVVFPYHKILRTKTKLRIIKKVKILKNKLNRKIISEKRFKQSFDSYLGILVHCRGKKVKKELNRIIDS